MTNSKEMIEWLQKYDENEEIAVAIWSEVDVLERAKEREMTITKEQAKTIIDRIHRKQDATLGISWDTIDCYLDDLKTEICNQCGKSVAWGSGRFVNRVPSFDDEETRRENGYPFPKGDFTCAECDDNARKEP